MSIGSPALRGSSEVRRGPGMVLPMCGPAQVWVSPGMGQPRYGSAQVWSAQVWVSPGILLQRRYSLRQVKLSRRMAHTLYGSAQIEFPQV
jgi:hypothetical protein